MNTLRVDAPVCEVRHAAGPVSWFMLEHLAMHAAVDGDELVVATSVRDLAVAVSLNKDTVARAVGVLAELGLVTRHQPAIGGRFAGGQYVLALPAGLSLLPANAELPLTRQRRAHARTHARSHDPAQLNLLDLDADEQPAALDGGHRRTPQPSDALAPEVPGAVHESRRGTHEPESPTC